MEHNGFHEEIFGPQVFKNIRKSICQSNLPLLRFGNFLPHCQVTSFSDNEEREEPASQSEIVVEAEVSFCPDSQFEGSWGLCWIAT